MKKAAKYLATLGFIFALIASTVVSPVHAASNASTNANVKLEEGALYLDNYQGSTPADLVKNINFTNGANEYSLGNMAYNVFDLRGSGAGWRVQIQATPLKEKTPAGGFVDGTSAIVLPDGVKVSSVAANADSNGYSSSKNPLLKASDNVFIDGASPVNLVSAPLNEGLGHFVLSTNFSYNLAGNVAFSDLANYPDGDTPYESVLTVTLVAGP